MFSRIKRRLTYANIVATLALLFAMSGGALAATHYLITSTKQISPKVIASLKGADGKNGTPGIPGTAGPAGPTGAVGSQGQAGAKGETGAQGPQGEPGETGAKGSRGTAGPAGAPGTTGFTKTLPAGETETGAWVAAGPPANQCWEHELSGTACEESYTAHGKGLKFRVRQALSFSIPLAEPPAAVNVVGVEEGEKEPNEKLPAGCKGNVAKPGAEPGNLCIFEQDGENVTSVTAASVISTSGVVIKIARGSEEESYLEEGTWAVTAKPAP